MKAGDRILDEDDCSGVITSVSTEVVGILWDRHTIIDYKDPMDCYHFMIVGSDGVARPQPKFKIGDEVTFDHEGEDLTGEIVDVWPNLFALYCVQVGDKQYYVDEGELDLVVPNWPKHPLLDMEGFTPPPKEERDAIKKEHAVRYQLIDQEPTLSVSEFAERYAESKARKAKEEEDKALRDNSGKLEFDHIHPAMYAYLARVGHVGGRKYTKGNYLKGGKPASEYINSAMRHLMKLMGGEWTDPETGCEHGAHVAWNMLMLCWATEAGLLEAEDYLPTQCKERFAELFEMGEKDE